jgi:hypothetical protein
MIRRGWKGNDSCPFSGVQETIQVQHLFFFLAKDAWTVVKNNFGIHTTPLVLNTSWETGFKKFSTGYRELVLSPSTAAGRPEDTT